MKSFLQGKKCLAIPALRLPAGLAAPNSSAAPGAQRGPRHAHSPATAAAPGSPHVEVVKEGDKVVRLVVTCACGERIEVECLYPAGS